jgi:glycosyltransferase involved in cell wall biosynthesis
VHVVDDGSNDGTVEVALKAGASVSRHDVNRGYDSALDTGIIYAVEAGYFAAITMDADGQLPVANIPEFIRSLQEGGDLVVGNRGKDLPRWSESLFAYFGKRIFGIDDPFCGMKGYRLNFIKAVGLESNERSIGTKLALRMVAKGAKHTNVPIQVVPRDGVSRMGSRLKSEFVLFKAALHGVIYYQNIRKPTRRAR